jgi:chitinase
MFKKNLFGVLLSLGVLSLFSAEVFAAVDIELEDDKENKEITVTVNSNEEYLDGIDVDIMYSGITVDQENTVQTEEFCSVYNNISFSEGKLSIECLNDSGTVVDGTIVTIPYTSEAEDYSVYIDTETVDLGTKELGSVVNINYSEESDDTEDSEKSEDVSIVDTVLNFVSDNFLYIASGALLVIALVVLIVILASKKEEVTTVAEPSTETSTDSQESTPVSE